MGQLQPYSQTPYDSNLSPESNNFQRWLQTSINSLIGVLYPLPAPTVDTVGFAGAVQIKWNEVAHAGYYLVFETEDQNAPTDDIPVGTVPANKGGTQNSFLRSGIGDDTTRYYWVQPFSPSGVPGKIGGGIAGTATSFIPTGLSGSLIEIGIDSALQQVREDFVSGGIIAGVIGAFGLTPITRVAATFAYQPGAYPFIGIFRLSATAATNDGAMLVPYSAQANPAVSPFGALNALPIGAHVKMQWILITNQTTLESIRIGFTSVLDAATVGEHSTDPPDGIFFRYDTLAGYAAGGDTTWKAEGRKKIATISIIARLTNVVTVTTAAPHGLSIGDTVIISGILADTTFNGGLFTVASTPLTTTFTYAQTGGNATPAVDTSSVSRATVLDTGVTPITTGYLRFEIESSVPGVFAFRISNGTNVSQDKTINTGNGDILPTATMGFQSSIVARSASARTLDIDYLGIGFNSLIQPDPTKARWF